MYKDLAYGKKRLKLSLPDHWDITVVEPYYEEGLSDEAAAIREALNSPINSPPLRQLVNSSQQIGIVINDITRATPTQLIIEVILELLSPVIPLDQITLFVALGTHRRNTEEELRGILGDSLYDSLTIVQNSAFDPTTQQHIGRSQEGHDIWINAQLASCDLLILTGFIEPHFFGGFSGGGKAIMPGMAGIGTILDNHAAPMIAAPGANWGITYGNPIWEEIREIGVLFNPFLVNVTMNRDKAITKVFAGDLKTAHDSGCAYAKQTAMVPVEEPFDIVVTSNSGYPLDLNLYQSVKGMSAAAEIVKKGGSILMAAECWDGIPNHGLFYDLLRTADSPANLIDTIMTPGFCQQDQWQAQVLAHILAKAEIFVHSENLTDEMLTTCFLKPANNIESTLQELVQKIPRVSKLCLLPEGPLTIPYIQ